MLAACATGGFGPTVKRAAFTSSEYGVAVSPRVSNDPNPPRGGGRYQVGNPYTVRGKTYVPQHDPNYAASGSASWYGADFHGRRTANGEIFSANAITAAHPTLPLPSYVRVTNADNGRSLIVRVNDRGPYVAGRIIDLSYRAASMLGYVNKGSANVHVEYVGQAPLEGDDTHMLVASYNGPADFDAGPIRVASSGGQSSRSLVGMTTNFITGLFSYADSTPQEADAAIGSAHAAVNAMATGNAELAAWAASVDADSRAVNFGLGIYADPGNVAVLAERFALLGAVTEEAVTANGRPATRLTLTHLKPGATLEDAHNLARELGLTDTILY
jgi:rare lipoprotein A